jgi:membrane associated rhomboid family serine protease
MILQDYIKCENTPWITYLLITINIIIFIPMLFMSSYDVSDIYSVFAVIPVELTFVNFYTLFTSMFLHAGFFHLLGNMIFLWIFADNIEDNLGKVRFILFYLLCGVCANAVHIFTNINSNIPTLGASGAISGMMGAYLVLYPEAKLKFVPLNLILFIPEIFIELKKFSFNIPAYLFLVIWIGMQLYSGFSGGAVGIAIWAHVGGFFAGFIGIRILMRDRETKGIVEDVDF